MTVFKVTKRKVSEDSFFITVDTTNIDEEYVTVNGPKQLEQLQNLLIKANCGRDVFHGQTRESWLVTVARDDEMNRNVIGTLEFVKKFYAKVEFTVKHTITRLVEIAASDKRTAAEILSNNIDDDMPDILETLSEEVYEIGNLDSQECEVLSWGTNPEDLLLNHSRPVKSYTEED